MLNTRPNPALVLLLLALLLQSCGFQLRGTGTSAARLPASISPVYIDGLGENDDLKRELTGLLHSDTVVVTDDSADAGSILRIRDQRSQRRVLAIDSAGKVVEFELYEALRFDLVDGNGRELVPWQNLSITRPYLNADVLVLGKAEEELNLREGMRRDLANQLVARLARQLQ